MLPDLHKISQEATQREPRDTIAIIIIINPVFPVFSCWSCSWNSVETQSLKNCIMIFWSRAQPDWIQILTLLFTVSVTLAKLINLLMPLLLICKIWVITKYQLHRDFVQIKWFIYIRFLGLFLICNKSYVGVIKISK